MPEIPVLHYLESLAVLPGTLAKWGSLPSAARGAIVSNTLEATTFIITRPRVPQKRVIVTLGFGPQTAKLEKVPHPPLTPKNLHSIVSRFMHIASETYKQPESF